MLLIYVPRITNRLGYTINVVFHSLLRIPYIITTDQGHFTRHEGAKISYGDAPVADEPFFRCAPLLFQTSIAPVETNHFMHDGQHALFPVPLPSQLPFDPFAAIFFMTSRYEEYLPHAVDQHNRFPASESIAFKHGFLHQAVVDRWAIAIRQVIEKAFPSLEIAPRTPDFQATIDIDAAYCYRHKGQLRTIRGILLDLMVRHDYAALKRRIRVLLDKEDDPYDTFDYILATAKRHPSLKPIFFILLGDYSIFDKPIPHTNRTFRQLLQHLSDNSKIGIHPSYYTLEHPEAIEKETQRLSNIIHRTIVRSRNHFLRIQFPQSYHDLIQAGLLHDYTMGYPDEPGFRCGTGTAYPFFDLTTNQEQDLTIHPFAVMDTTLNTYKGYTTDQAWETYKQLIDETARNGGTLVSLWHNQNLCEDFGWQGWRSLFEQYAAATDEACR